jgi:hypothetical protein
MDTVVCGIVSKRFLPSPSLGIRIGFPFRITRLRLFRWYSQSSASAGKDHAEIGDT